MTWALTAVAVAVAGTGVAVYGQVQQAQIAEASGEYNAKVAQNAALQAEMDASENIRRKREDNRRMLAMQRGRYAKSGVTEAGTPLEVMAETAGILELDALEVGRQSRIEAARLRSQAGYDLAMGKAGAQSAYTGAGASLLSGASSAAWMGYQGGQAGSARSSSSSANMALNHTGTGNTSGLA